eukprot:jgi/Astpho2/3279/Aster-08043
MVTTFESGRMALFANGSCLTKAGKTHVLATAACSQLPNDTPSFQRARSMIQFDYRERAHAVGKMPRSRTQKEFSHSDREVAVSALMDRAFRPLFPPGFSRFCQAAAASCWTPYCKLLITANVLCTDGQIDPDVVAINAVSAALSISNIPWAGPLAAVRVTRTEMGSADGTLTAAPTLDDQRSSGLNLLYVGTADKALLVDFQGEEVFETELQHALKFAHSQVKLIIAAQQQLRAEAGQEPMRVELSGADPSAAHNVEAYALPVVQEVLSNPDSTPAEQLVGLREAQQRTLDHLKARGRYRHAVDIDYCWPAIQAAVLRDMVLRHNRRPDGRGLHDLRTNNYEKKSIPMVHGSMWDPWASLKASVWQPHQLLQVDSIPVVHGSTLNTQGNTQSLVTATIGGDTAFKFVDSLHERPQLMVQYSARTFASIENASKREPDIVQRRSEALLEGFLEKALATVFPSEQQFPFTAKLSAEMLAIDGASATAALEGASLALMDAGVPSRSRHASDLVADRVRVQVGLLTDVPQPYLSGIIGGSPEVAQSISRASAYIARLPGLEQQHIASTAQPAEEGAARAWLDGTARGPPASHPLAAAAAAGDHKGLGNPSPQSSHEFMFDTTDLEEQHADMLLSVAGTVQGLTALQMHVRAQGGIELQHLLRALQLARPARLQKLRAMGNVAAKLRPLRSNAKRSALCQLTVGPWDVLPCQTLRDRQGDAAALVKFQIPSELVGRLIGTQGSVVRGLQDSTGALLTIVERDGEDHADVYIYGPSGYQCKQAEVKAKSVTGMDVSEGEVVEVTVTALKDYGAFVELPSGNSTLLHISELSWERVKSMEQHLQLGQKLHVKVIGRDKKGNISVSHKVLLPREAEAERAGNSTCL